MNYVVVDLEWNQALSSNSPVFNHLPIHLSGEIIEIGAVRLNSDMTPGEEFTIDIKPVYFRKIHYKVKKITGFDSDRLENGFSFSEAFSRFREWCGDDVTFLTWGSDDRNIMEQNIIIHDLDWDWISDWINLQTIFNLQTGGGKEQKSLAGAMEYFNIEQTRVAHDALGDAYNTALVCSNLDMREGLRLYPDADRILTERMRVIKATSDPEADSGALSCDILEGLNSKAEVFATEFAGKITCPECGTLMVGNRWINQGDQRYINILKCEEHGLFFIRLKFKKRGQENIWDVKKLVYEAGEEQLEIYKAKLNQARRRGRKHTLHKSHPA